MSGQEDGAVGGPADTIGGDGDYLVAVVCPGCGERDVVTLQLRARLETSRDEVRLGVRAKAGKRDHRCGQTSLTVLAETGEVLRLDMGEQR